VSSILRLPLRYRSTLIVAATSIVATYLARWILGPDPTADQTMRLGYGLPAMEDGRVWTLVTGAVLLGSLSIPFPLFTLIAVAVYERVAGHWRPLVAVFGGQVVGMAIVLLAVTPLRSVSTPFAEEVTTAIDFGISVGAFCCLGAWTAYLRGPARRLLRWSISCYHIGPFLLSGLIYDLSHPTGWFIGLAGGSWLMRPDELDRTPFTTRELEWILPAVAIGIAVGVYVGWTGGGVGGVFGWGPGD
jgi:phosphatidylglycerol lysyltransferase